jgi:hypothetical protein
MAEATPSGQYTTKALPSKAEHLNARRADVAGAAAWAIANGKGEAAAASSGLFPLASRGKIRSEIKRLQGSRVVVRDHHNQIGTNTERLQIANWALLSADGQKPKDRVEVSLKIIDQGRAARSAQEQQGAQVRAGNGEAERRGARRAAQREGAAQPHLLRQVLCVVPREGRCYRRGRGPRAGHQAGAEDANEKVPKDLRCFVIKLRLYACLLECGDTCL